MADIKGLYVNNNIIANSGTQFSKGLFKIPATIDTQQEQFDINIDWISSDKELLTVDVFLIHNAGNSLRIVESNSPYILANTEDKVTFKGEQGTEFTSYYLVSFSSSTMQRICRISLQPVGESGGGSIPSPGGGSVVI